MACLRLALIPRISSSEGNTSLSDANGVLLRSTNWDLDNMSTVFQCHNIRTLKLLAYQVGFARECLREIGIEDARGSWEGPLRTHADLTCGGQASKFQVP